MILRQLSYRLRLLSILALLLCGAASCIKDDLPDPDADPDAELDTSGYSLGITITLDNDLRTRASAGDGDFDNYIDTRNKLRVLFFDENGQFIFEATDRTVMNRPASESGEEWFVHVPVNYVVDSSGNAYDAEALKEQLKTHDFKVAILANWDTGSEPKWGYRNSILYTGTGKDVKNINDLHLLTNDSNYNSTSGTPKKSDVYGFIWGGSETNSSGGKLGVKTQWVETRSPEKGISNQETAREWIRGHWNPATDASNYPPYTDLWLYWNFDYNSSTNYSGTYATQWRTRNYNDFSSWLTTGRLSAKQNNAFYEVRDASGNWKDAGEFKVGGSSDTYYEYNSTTRRYGIRLEAISNATQKKDDGTYEYVDKKANVQSVIKFRFPATGVMWVKWASSDGNSATITVEKRNKENQGIPQSHEEVSSSSTSIQTYEKAITVTEDSEYMSIYCTTGEAIIYEIEYIADKYLYDTDRRGILPSASHPIPMYGVQKFGALTNWKPGSTFDLSHGDRKEHGETESEEGTNGNHKDYEVKHISLLRSVAKVELYLPRQNGNWPLHVYMRSMNRTSRNEPMDVETPTETLWPDDSHNLSSSTAGPCEWYTIQKHGPFCESHGTKNDSSSNDITTEYQNKLAWFYGSWLTAKWLDGGTKGWTFGKTADGKATDPTKYKSSTEAYPRLFNPSIDRSDYAEMIEVESEDSNYHKFILYMPDKNIDDPNTVGVYNSLTKIAHIEYRYANTVNLDDDDCYRVYFTNYGESGYQPNTTISGVARDDFDNNKNYEQESNNLKLHWPVMRNHIYRFVVGGSLSSRGDGNGGQEVRSTVTTWSGEPVIE